jgi:predicted 3-demethylubiquinone-9 3-methyltransferase (glyoxalase superfamily)
MGGVVGPAHTLGPHVEKKIRAACRFAAAPFDDEVKVGPEGPGPRALRRIPMLRQKVRTCLWFDGNAEEAAAFYVSVFKDRGDSGITSVTPGPNGAALVVAFRLAGVEFLALNGGPQFRFTEAVSLSVDCQSQEELDDLWEKLSAGGSAGPCGWLKDRYGLSWQIVPAVLPQLLASPTRAQRVMGALMGMSKLDIRALEAAAAAE